LDKEKVIAKIEEAGVIAIIRAENADKALKIAGACVAGGVRAIELTFTCPRADRIIEALADEYASGGLLVGAGTVMDSETARIALLSGAQFIVSPYFNESTLRLCNRYRAACMPGVMTIREAVMAMEAGADILKIFPADLFGPRIIKDICGPIPQARMIPTGGVDAANVAGWFEAGAFAVGAGSSLTGGDNYDEITKTAKLFIDNISTWRYNNKLVIDVESFN